MLSKHKNIVIWQGLNYAYAIMAVAELVLHRLLPKDPRYEDRTKPSSTPDFTNFELALATLSEDELLKDQPTPHIMKVVTRTIRPHDLRDYSFALWDQRLTLMYLIEERVNHLSKTLVEKSEEMVEVAQELLVDVLTQPVVYSPEKYFGDEPKEIGYGETNEAIYLREIGRVPLLTANEETTLAKQLEVGIASQQIIDSNPNLSADEKERLKDLSQRGEAARKHLTEANLRLVVFVARKYMDRGMSLLDLVQEGNIGLMRAIEKYDWRRGKLSTYAYWWIYQQVTKAIADQARTIRIPVHLFETIGKIGWATQQLQQLHGREPTDEELAKEVDMDPKRIREILSAIRQPRSLESFVGPNQDTTLGELIEDPDSINPEDEATKHLRDEDIKNALRSALNGREYQVLTMRVGLILGRPFTLQEIGDELGISRERVRQIEGVALGKLRGKPKLRLILREYLG